MVDWTQIVTTAMTLLIGGGGLVTLVTLRERKNGALLENIAKVLESNSETNKEWREIAAERAKRCQELKEDLDRKDGKIDELYKSREDLTALLDEERTARAVAEVFKCDVVGCALRHPPFGKGVVTMDRKSKT